MPTKINEYPAWICTECANGLGCPNRKTISSFHNGNCGWCLKETKVTEARDFGYPPFKGIVPKKATIFDI